jgi:1-acyl-sn-glycerol-3-phosphate acyltransferase
VIVLFPQGTTIPRGERPWLRGAARLALATGAPILPVAIVDSEKALRPAKLKIGFPRVKVIVGEPIAVTPGRATIAVARELTDQVRLAIDDLRSPYPPPAHVRLD